MSDLSSPIEIASQVRELPDDVLNRLITAEDDGTSKSWLAFVYEHAHLDQEMSATAIKHEDENLCELIVPLPTLTVGPWRSLGGCLDYSRWADRDRFIELDKILTAAPSPRAFAA